jgi:hypothetical protein
LDRTTAEKMIELRAAGKSIRTIADELCLSKTTVFSRLRRLSDEVENAVALAKDRLLEQLKLDQVSVFEAKLNLYQKLQEQIEQRDFSDVPTDRLVKAWLSLGCELKIDRMSKLLIGSSFDAGFFSEVANE